MGVASETRFWARTLSMSRFEPDLERDLERQGAVVGVGGLHVDALLDAVDLLLDRRRHRRLDVGGGRAHEGRRDLDHRGHDLGVLGDRQARHRHERPAITVTMEITIATIGRLTKKRAMATSAFPGSVAGSAARRLRRRRPPASATHDRAVAHLLEALDDDLLAGLQALLDHPEAVHPRAHLDVAERHLVVGADHGHAVEVLQLGHGALRHEERARLQSRIEAGAAVLARAA